MAPEQQLATPQRVFFALWPDAPLRMLLAGLAAEVARESGGRATAANLLHLTLAFLGDQPPARVEALHRVGAGVRARPFALALDTIGGFRGTGIAWLGASAPQSELAALHAELMAALHAWFPIWRFYSVELNWQIRSRSIHTNGSSFLSPQAFC